MSETLNTGEYAALRGEIKNKQIGSMIMGTLGALCIGVAIAAAVVATGGGAAIPLIGGMGATGAGILAAVAGVFGIAGSWKAMQTDIELQMDFDELRARRNAATLSQAIANKDLTPQQAAAVGVTMAQNQEPNYPQNRRADGRQWGDVVNNAASAAILTDAAVDIAR